MSKGVRDLLIACTQSERERAEYNAKLPPEEATMSDEEAEFIDAMVANLVASEFKAQKDSGLACLAWSIARLADCEARKGGTEAPIEKYLRDFFLGSYLATVDGGHKQPVLLDDGTWAKATSSDIDTAIAEVKQAGLWPWKAVAIM